VATRQLSLWTDKRSIEERFDEFHRENPEVYRLFVERTRAIKAAGWTHYSVKTLMETARYHADLQCRDQRGFRLNNDFTALYARKLMDEFPEEFGGFFELRERRAQP
jgi:hypothetical protein